MPKFHNTDVVRLDKKEDPMYRMHEYHIDIQNNNVYLFGNHNLADINGEEPGLEFTMSNRFIFNMHLCMKTSELPVIIHMKTCFSRKTPITTSVGVKPIKDVKIGDLVLTHTGKYKPVTNIMSQMYDGEMVRLYYGRKKHNGTSIIGTGEHPIWVERNGVRTWKPMSEIINGDIIFVENNTCERTGEKIPWWKTVKNYNAERLRRIGNSPLTKKLELPILKVCEQLQQEGWTVVPTDMGVRPDIVGFKDGKITVFEVDNMTGKSLEVKKKKYDNAPIKDFIDDIIWMVPEEKYQYSWYEADDISPFIKVKVTGKKTWKNKIKQRVYNLTVKDDNSYVANKVVVHNCGGDWDEGMAIFDTLISYPYNTTILNYTHARSMSSVVFQAATKRVMMPNSNFMFHEGTYADNGNNRTVISGLEFYKDTVNVMLNIYAKRMKQKGKFSKHSIQWITDMLIEQMQKKDDVYLTAKETVQWGLADEIFDGDWSRLGVYTQKQTDHAIDYSLSYLG